MSVSNDSKWSEVKFDDSSVFSFEANFNVKRTVEWMARNRHHAFYYFGLYLLFIIFGPLYMKNRPRLDVQRALVVWNFMLAAFSIAGLWRMIPGSVLAIKNFGITYLSCNVVFDRPSAFWGWLFALSKVLELGDTIFIVLRKQELVFLHYYHHISVLPFVWYSYSEYTAPTRWFTLMNYFAHSLMYSYYTLRALRVAVPNFVAQIVTSAQVLQMVIGLYICYIEYITIRRGQFCACPEYFVVGGIIMYLSYFVLFVIFFYNKYLFPKTKLKKSD